MLSISPMAEDKLEDEVLNSWNGLIKNEADRVQFLQETLEYAQKNKHDVKKTKSFIASQLKIKDFYEAYTAYEQVIKENKDVFDLVKWKSSDISLDSNPILYILGAYGEKEDVKQAYLKALDIIDKQIAEVPKDISANLARHDKNNSAFYALWVHRQDHTAIFGTSSPFNFIQTIAEHTPEWNDPKEFSSRLSIVICSGVKDLHKKVKQYPVQFDS